MREQGFTRAQADGELFSQLWEENPTYGQDLSEELSRFSGTSGPDEALVWLRGLRSLVSAGKPTDQYAYWQMDQMLLDRLEDLASYKQKPIFFVEKWRRWKPGRCEENKSISMRDMESSLRTKWLDRLIAHILPRGKDFSQITPLLATEDLAKEVRHLVGATRFRTLRVHCLNLEFLLHLGLRLPWD